MVAEPQAADIAGSDRFGAPADSTPKQQVLIIDDDPVMRMLLGIGLRAQGYDCLVAENGKAAQELVVKSRVDVMVVDLMMPVMDGLAFIAWLRGNLRNTTPVVAVSNLNDPRIRDRALALGASEVVVKPVQLQVLVAVLRRSVPAHSVP
jgi:DNA-binding response OmpR family regulator